MRRNVEIEQLGDMAPGIVFPGEDRAFDSFTYRLRAVVEENFGREVAQAMSWSKEHLEYHFTMTDTAVIGGEPPPAGKRALAPFRVRVEHTFALNPKKPLSEELERLKDELRDFRLTCSGTEFRQEEREDATKAAAK